jgi:L,D-transpeptidase YcbB
MISIQILPTVRAAALGTALAITSCAMGQAQQLPASESTGGQSQGYVPTAPSGPGTTNGPDCATALPEDPRAALFVPPQQPPHARHGHPTKQEQTSDGRLVLTDDPNPTLQPETAFCTQQAAGRYRQIADEGGWPMIPKPLRQDAAPGDVRRLRQRLSIEGDLHQNGSSEDLWDDALTDALKNFQRRAGLEQSGLADKMTLKALNVPADIRARELEASAQRIADLNIPFDQAEVVVNIPTASVEAVKELRVVQRHAAIVGKINDPSPQLTTVIRSITLNPTWTIPRSIVEHEVLPRLRRDPRYLRRAKLVVLDRRGRRVSLHRILRPGAAAFTFRQEPGAKNALGRLRIDMPNRYDVYMHDTPAQRLFTDNYRFLSHGCVRVYGVYDLAAWLLSSSDTPGDWDPAALADPVRGGRQKKIELARALPVAWVYLDAWESANGVVHYAPDVYDQDGTGYKGRPQLHSQAP